MEDETSEIVQIPLDEDVPITKKRKVQSDDEDESDDESNEASRGYSDHPEEQRYLIIRFKHSSEAGCADPKFFVVPMEEYHNLSPKQKTYINQYDSNCDDESMYPSACFLLSLLGELQCPVIFMDGGDHIEHFCSCGETTCTGPLESAWKQFEDWPTGGSYKWEDVSKLLQSGEANLMNVNNNLAWAWKYGEI
jgi:hypothetical protein